MKAFTLVVLFGLVAALTWSCSDSLSLDEAASNNITFQTSQSSYTSGEVVTATLKNGSSRPITYGNPFQVLQKIDGKWTYVGPKLNFYLIAYTMKPDGQTTYRVALTDSLFPDHPFSGGQYRLTTSVGIGEDNYTAKTASFRVSGSIQQ